MLFGPAYEISVLNAYAQMPLMNVHTALPSKARVLKFGLNFHLYLYFVYASSEGSDESVHTHRLI